MEKTFFNAMTIRNIIGRDRLAQSGEHPPTNLAIQAQFSRWEVLCTCGNKHAASIFQIYLTNEATRWKGISLEQKGHVAQFNRSSD